MVYLLLGFLVSTLCTLLVIRFASGRHTADTDTSGPQKFHARPVPRIGGLGILCGAMAGGAALIWTHPQVGHDGAWLVACGLPAFAAGFIEDLTKRVTPRIRLLAAAVSGALGVWAIDAAITHSAIPGLDWVVAFPLGAALVTVFVVAGMANAINIIDGFNGLASMCVLIMLLSLGYVAFQVDDTLVALWTMLGAGAVLGFFVWNYPAGLIFLGDGGAYFLGFYVAELSILLIHRNPTVSPLFPLLICIYPVVETLFSIYRRKWLRDVSPGMPDGIHLHSLVYRRLVRWAVGNRSAKALTRKNSMTSPYLWMLCMMSVIPGLLFWQSTVLMATCIGLFVLTYIALYWSIVRFRSPRWLVLRR